MDKTVSEARINEPDMTAAYLDGPIHIFIQGYYVHFLDDIERYDPRIVAESMVEIYEQFDDEFHIPRAVALHFSEVLPDLSRYEGHSRMVVLDRAVSPEQRTKKLGIIDDSEVVDVNQITPDALRRTINAHISPASNGRMAKACNAIQVRAAEFTDLPPPADRPNSYGDQACLTGLDAGFDLEIGDSVTPYGISLDIAVGRGLYGVEGMPGTKRLQAAIAKILKSMPHLEVQTAFEPIPPDHWSLAHYT